MHSCPWFCEAEWEHFHVLARIQLKEQCLSLQLMGEKGAHVRQQVSSSTQLSFLIHWPAWYYVWWLARGLKMCPLAFWLGAYLPYHREQPHTVGGGDVLKSVCPYVQVSNIFGCRWYLLSHWTVCNQTFYDGALSRDRVLCEKVAAIRVKVTVKGQLLKKWWGGPYIYKSIFS